MKTRIRIYALPLMMVVTLVTVTGCATHGKPSPTITLDEPVSGMMAAQLLPEIPKHRSRRLCHSGDAHRTGRAHPSHARIWAGRL